MKKAKLKSVALALTASACIAAPAHAGLFGGLGGDIAKESTQMARWIIQAEQMMEEIELLKKNYSSGIDLKEQHDVPLTWQDVVAAQLASEGDSGQGTASVYREQLAKYEEVVKTLDASMTQEDEGIDGGRANRTYNLNNMEVKHAFAAAESIYDSIKKRTDNLKALEDKIGAPIGVRGAMDLNSRIQLEIGYLQADIARLNAIHQRLTAAQLNQDTQAQAANKEFFLSYEEYQKRKEQQQPAPEQGIDPELEP